MRGLRAAIIYEGFAHAIADTCPTAWVINYTNPMSICTRTLTRVEQKLRVFGCCHEVFGTQRLLASLVKNDGALLPARDEIRVDVLGINHFTWIDRAFYKQVDLLALLRNTSRARGSATLYARQRSRVARLVSERGSGQIRVAPAVGILAAAGDRHLVEFLPGFTRSPEELFRWGVIRTPMSYRHERWRRARTRRVT